MVSYCEQWDWRTDVNQARANRKLTVASKRQYESAFHTMVISYRPEEFNFPVSKTNG
jgi:hypothetical protein